VNYLAFYSLSKKTIWISVDDANLHVLAHEIGHAVVDHYFKVRPPYNIHELMAQFVEKHITD
jgi:predicted metalloprotease